MDRVPTPNPDRLARLNRQVAAGYISPAEFAEAVTLECALMDPAGMEDFCEGLDPQWVAAVRDRAENLLADPSGRLGIVGFVALGHTPAQLAALSCWLTGRYGQLLAVARQRAGEGGPGAESDSLSPG